MTDITERLRELSKARWDKDAWERETTVRIPAEPDRDIDLVLSNAAAEIDRLRARVAELEAAKGEPGVWLRDQRGHYEGRETLDPMFYLGARNPGRGANGATYSPFYAAPPAPRVDVDAISDEALNAAWSYIIFNAENEQTEAVYDMRAALRAIFNKGE